MKKIATIALSGLLLLAPVAGASSPQIELGGQKSEQQVLQVKYYEEVVSLNIPEMSDSELEEIEGEAIPIILAVAAGAFLGGAAVGWIIGKIEKKK